MGERGREPNAEHCSSSFVLPLRSSPFLPPLFPSDLAALSVFPLSAIPGVRPEQKTRPRRARRFLEAGRGRGLVLAQLAAETEKREGFQCRVGRMLRGIDGMVVSETDCQNRSSRRRRRRPPLFLRRRQQRRKKSKKRRCRCFARSLSRSLASFVPSFFRRRRWRRLQLPHSSTAAGG